MSFRGLALVLLALIFLSSCSSRQLGYRYAENLVAWQLHQSISLERQQRRELRAELDRFLQWHAETQMPAYYALLKQVQVDIENSRFSDELLAQYSEQVMQFWYDFRLELLPYAERFLADLSEEQQRNLLVSLQERLQEDDKPKRRSSKDPQQEQITQMEDRVASAFGRLQQSQKDYIQVWAEQHIDSEELWREYQLAWLDSFTNVMMLPAGTEGRQDLLQRLFLTPEEWRGENLITTLAHNEQVGTQLILQLLSSIDVRQQRHVIREIDRLRRDLRGMMRQRGVTV
ncbi:DUF6279 family lipoprotein [Aliidiomarina haloalkalitolerans]|uniref:Lipoprotein n=1 Tax=Aliidiomarina haloalkalitolerans TaxID=859059 RepID=A0A432VY97_9GAMM|nr:DUF6279 family lipoprotein [Aliidiomarina haloalkalitolerans]RUO21637.1 hypothetical protein CWE06_01940 [Aliidiomarina haloalkalitolerans]